MIRLLSLAAMLSCAHAAGIEPALERFQHEWNRSSPYFASNFDNITSVRDSSQADVALTGLWLTQDHDGIVKVTNCGGSLCAEIAGVILDHATDPTPVDYRGVSQCHLALVSDARPIRPNLWKGHIIDPRNGSVYGVELSLDPHNNLALRGFLGIPLLGHTQIWTRYAGKVPDDCRLEAGTAVTAETPGDAPDRTLPSALERVPK